MALSGLSNYNMKNTILVILLSTLSISSFANDPRPHVVHMGLQSCITSYYGNETFVSCDEDFRKIDEEFAKENARIDRQEQHDRDLEKKIKAIEAEHETKMKDLDERYAVAKEKWHQCLRKRMPKGANINNAKVKDLDACRKDLDSWNE